MTKMFVKLAWDGKALPTSLALTMFVIFALVTIWEFDAYGADQSLVEPKPEPAQPSDKAVDANTNQAASTKVADTAKPQETPEINESASTEAPEKTDAERRADTLREQWGVEIESLRISAGGYMMDFRYRVIDPEKAAPLFVRTNVALLTDEASGATFSVPAPPKVGPLRHTRPPQADKVYFVLFANPQAYVKPGNKVTVTIGDFKAEHIVVQ